MVVFCYSTRNTSSFYGNEEHNRDVRDALLGTFDNPIKFQFYFFIFLFFICNLSAFVEMEH